MDSDQNQTMDASSIQPKFMDFRRTGFNPISKPIQNSQTLMRNTVDRQALSTMPIATSAPIAPTDVPPVIPKTSVASVDQERLNRAQSTSRSDMVNRFGAPAEGTPSPLIESPTEQAAAPETEPIATAPMSNTPIEKTDEPYQPSMDLFNEKLRTATAHNEPPVLPDKKGGKKVITALSTMLVIVIGLGLFVNLNINKLDVYLAASKAGFSATLPSNGPSGFSLSKVSSAAGIIATTYSSNSDGRNYTITERQSLWSNQTLLDNYVIPMTSGDYQVYTTKGLSLYIYGNKNITWVHGGIWYIVTSNNSLSDTQLINIATTM